MIDLLIYSYLLYEFEVSARHQVQLFYWEFYNCFFSSESIYSFRAKHAQKAARTSLLCMLVSLFVCFCLFEAGKGHTWPCFITFPQGTTPKYQWYVVKTQHYKVISKVNYWWLKRTKAFIARLRFTMYQRHHVRAKAGVGLVQVRFRPWGPFFESPGNFTGPKSNIQIEI